MAQQKKKKRKSNEIHENLDEISPLRKISVVVGFFLRGDDDFAIMRSSRKRQQRLGLMNENVSCFFFGGEGRKRNLSKVKTYPQLFACEFDGDKGSANGCEDRDYCHNRTSAGDIFLWNCFKHVEFFLSFD